MIKIAVCDDDPDFLSQASAVIAEWNQKRADFTVCGFRDGDSLIEAHRQSPFSIIFLDIVMPLINGIETAREIRSRDSSVKIVFLTSSEEYAVESYSVKANDYLLKPIVPQKLISCLDGLVKEIESTGKFILIKSSHSLTRVLLSNIEYLEAQNKSVIFSLCDGRIIRSIEPFHSYSDLFLLDDGFYKCHRSYIVNLFQIDNYTSSQVVMHSGKIIPISRGCSKEFEESYFSVIFGKAGAAK